MEAFLALDLATNTGWTVLIERDGWQPPLVEVGSFRCKGQSIDRMAASLSTALVAIIRDLRKRDIAIKLAGIEDFVRDPRHSSAAARNLLPGLQCATVAILCQFGIPWELVAPATWRKSFIGTGFAPSFVPSSQRRRWLKQQVRQKADRLGRRAGFATRNDDEGDAIGLAFYLAEAKGSRSAVFALRAA
jgi:hypothetical protein